MVCPIAVMARVGIDLLSDMGGACAVYCYLSCHPRRRVLRCQTKASVVAQNHGPFTVVSRMVRISLLHTISDSALGNFPPGKNSQKTTLDSALNLALNKKRNRSSLIIISANQI
jgi:hypothetical protein